MHGRRMRDDVFVDRRDHVAGLGFGFRWREDRIVNYNMNRFHLCRDEIHAPAITMIMGRYRPGSIGRRSLQLSGNLFCMLLMPLEYLEAGLQQALEFGIAGRRD